MRFYGVDVSKETLDVDPEGKVVQIGNDKKSIRAFLKNVPTGSVVAMESTNRYHQMMADMCYSAGMVVYVVNPRMTRHYREALNLRGHTDKLDAKTICSYIRHHHEELRPYVPKSADQRRLQGLIRRRAKLVGVRVQLLQSMREIKELKADLDAVIKRIDRMIAQIDVMIDKQLEGNADRERLCTIKGVGPVVSALLVTDLQAGNFRSADAFVAFYGLDPAPNDSGKSKGRRKISKKGHRLGRTMLYIAAFSAASSKAWKPIYERILAKGLSRVQALVCLARKIARTAWSIYTHKTEFTPGRLLVGLT
jgi:transposase